MSGIILRNGRLIDGTGRIWDRVDIHIEGAYIRGISPDGLKDAQAESVDLAGKTVIPGLINCHTHICGERLEATSGATSTQLVAEYAVRGARWLEQALKKGVTAIRDLGGIEHVDLGLKRLIDKGMIAGPRIRAAGRAICMTGGHGYRNGIEVDGPDEVRKAARLQLKAGADVIKLIATGGILTPGTQPGSPQLTQAEMAAAVDEAHKAGRTAAAHAEGRMGIRNAILAGVDSIEHGYELDGDIIELMLKQGTFLCPTLTCDLCIAECGIEFGIPADSVDKMKRWIDHLLDSFQRAYKAGVRIAAGNDAFADWISVGDMASEVAAMVQYGMNAHDALSAATANAAQLLQLADEGVVAPGKRANLVVLNGDPLVDIKAVGQVAAVMKNGDWVTRCL
ncbi:amidohydrolase family protein [Candidatus Poribacteria bacterium]|nr:amidohydrolase family protein [Candidatus Poribacteria bacterium]